MVSKIEMVKVITKSKLITAVRKKRKKVVESWNKEKIAEQLSFTELRKLYASFKTKAKPVKKKVTRKKPAKKKKVGVVKKKTATKKTKKRRK